VQVQMVESVLSDVTDTKGRVFLDLSLLRDGLTLIRSQALAISSIPGVLVSNSIHDSRSKA
jgi:hypothetical protein